MAEGLVGAGEGKVGGSAAGAEASGGEGGAHVNCSPFISFLFFFLFFFSFDSSSLLLVFDFAFIFFLMNKIFAK